MRLQPNVGSDRSWVWKVAADYSEQPPTAETLAIRFANPENAALFKTAFEEGQKQNLSLSKPEQDSEEKAEPKEEEEEEKNEEKNEKEEQVDEAKEKDEEKKE
jgi:Ran-binding protein 1